MGFMWTRLMVVTFVRHLIDSSKNIDVCPSNYHKYSQDYCITSYLVSLGGGDPHCIFNELEEQAIYFI